MRQNHSDEEIKEFIDSKKVLTKGELTNFCYPNRKYKHTASNDFINRWWAYVLKNKKWTELKKHQSERMNRQANYEKFKKIYLKDPRLKIGAGKHITHRLLTEIYGFTVHINTVQTYLRKIKNEKIPN